MFNEYWNMKYSAENARITYKVLKTVLYLCKVSFNHSPNISCLYFGFCVASKCVLQLKMSRRRINITPDYSEWKNNLYSGRICRKKNPQNGCNQYQPSIHYSKKAISVFLINVINEKCNSHDGIEINTFLLIPTFV